MISWEPVLYFLRVGNANVIGVSKEEHFIKLYPSRMPMAFMITVRYGTPNHLLPFDSGRKIKTQFLRSSSLDHQGRFKTSSLR